MRVTVLPGSTLPSDLSAAWSELQLADSALASPFFRPEYTALVASVRPDVFVAVLEDDGGIVGFFPFQRDGLRVGWPVGGTMSDYQAVVARPGAAWDAVELVRRCDLIAWEFNHLLAEQQPFAEFHRSTTDSPFMDLAAGFDAYALARRAAGSKQIKEVAYLTRRIQREVGPLRFEFQSSDPTVLTTLLRWKDDQHQRTDRENVLRIPWVGTLLDGIFHAKGDDFAGVLSALYAGDHLVAAHLGLRSRTALHLYVISYDRGFQRYSPGLIMILATAQIAPSLGIQVIDMGKGQAQYKDRLASGTTLIAEGTVDVPSIQNRLRHARLMARGAIRRSPIASPVRAAFRHARRRGWLRD